MGTSQSTQENDPSSQSNRQGSSEMKQDYYNLLGVDQNADPDEIKRAYRKKALELHPDKNVNNIATATELFSEIQVAYEVLSDPQERAWYDSHREQILRDSNDDVGYQDAAARAENVTITTAELLKQFPLFSSRMDMQDNNPQGFYATAGMIFERIAVEEERAAYKANIDYEPYPSFGNSKSSYEYDVKPFYTNWASFVTFKSFAWEDKYRYSEAPDRRVKRLMEKENRKLREAAMKEFNDTVKHFVMLIRRRDPRYLPNFQSEEERNTAAREISKDQSRKARLENAARMANYTEAEWTKTEDNWQDSESEDDKDDKPSVEFECVVCNKTFKTEKQVEMHEKSKKHIKAVQVLKRQMKKEGRSLGLDEDISVKPPSPQPISEASNNDNSESDGYLSNADTPNVIDPGSLVPVIGESENEPISPIALNMQRTSIGDDLRSTGSQGDLGTEENSVRTTRTAPKKKPRRKAKDGKSQTEPTNKCGVCGEVFDSRSKLFKHIRDENHAAAVQHTKHR